MTESQLKDKLTELGLDVAPECLTMLVARKTQNPEHRCQLSMAYAIRERAANVERDYQENEKTRETLRENLMDGFMADHQSVVKLSAGLISRLGTETQPLGSFTGRFQDISDLALYLLFDAPRSEKPWIKWWQLWK